MDLTFSKTTLANYAANKIGAKTFNFGDGSSSDKVFSSIYDICREFFLEECPWSFSVHRQALIQASLTSPIPSMGAYSGTIYVYPFPSDYIKIWKVSYPVGWNVVEDVPGLGPCLLSDQQTRTIKYIFNNDNPATYSAKAYEALACYLAWQACFKLVEAAQYSAKMEISYEKAFLSAAASDGQIGQPEEIDDSMWLWERLTGAGAAVGSPGGSLNIGWDPLGY